MDDIRSLTYRLEETVQNDPLSCCCVPYQQNLPALPAPRDAGLCERRLALPETGQRVIGQQYVNLELYPLPCRPAPQIKTELRGGKLIASCDCVKRNGLQDSCPAFRCMVVNHRNGCAALPLPACAQGKRQLAKYASLPDRVPEYCKRGQPPCKT